METSWEKMSINPDETGRLIFTAFVGNNNRNSANTSFGASSALLTADQIERIQLRIIDIMDITNERESTLHFGT